LLRRRVQVEIACTVLLLRLVTRPTLASPAHKLLAIKGQNLVFVERSRFATAVHCVFYRAFGLQLVVEASLAAAAAKRPAVLAAGKGPGHCGDARSALLYRRCAKTQLIVAGERRSAGNIE